MYHLNKKMMAVIMCVLMLLSVAGCRTMSRTVSEIIDSGTNGVWGQAPSSMPTGSALPTNEGQPGTWTIMLYLNGSDLESQGAEGTSSLQSIVDAQLPESIRVLIYTGGTSYWYNDTVDPNANQIWLAENNDLTLLETMSTKNMGESATLAEFITYAQNHYPADHKALMMWNHGAGSIIGFGADELYNYDGLVLSEMSEAFSASFDGEPFELIGFDACLMASVEMASVASPYARYMVASQEVEPGSGWDYGYFLEALGADTGMTGAELGETIAEGYFARSAGGGMEGALTCSVIDLSMIDKIEQLLGAYASSLDGQLAQPQIVQTLSYARQSVDKYGDEPGAGGTESFNMVDFYHFMELQEGGAAAQELLAAIKEAVVYERSGEQQPNSYGLSIYFPDTVPDSGDLSLQVYDTIDFCPEYKTFVSDYLTALNQNAQDMPVEYNSELIAASQGDDLSEVGSYYVHLTDAQMDYLSYVYCTLGMYLDDGTVVDLGYDSDLSIDYSDNTIHDNFQGYWTGLNGHFVAVYVMEEYDNEYVIYNMPVLYNGETAIIRATWIWDSTYENGGYYVYNGMYYMNEEYAAPSSKLGIIPEIGDQITPIFWPTYAADGDYENYYTGETFTVGAEGLVLSWIELPAGYYQYGFLFFDVYGYEHYSEMTDFEVY